MGMRWIILERESSEDDAELCRVRLCLGPYASHVRAKLHPLAFIGCKIILTLMTLRLACEVIALKFSVSLLLPDV